MTTIYLASVDTRNFTFDAAGASRDEALAALRAVLEAHVRQYGARVAPGWLFEVFEDVQIRELVLGVGYRDREPVQTSGG